MTKVLMCSVMCSMSRLHNYSHVPPYDDLLPLGEGEGEGGYLVLAAEPCLVIHAAWWARS